MLGLAVTVGMAPIRGPNRNPDGEERQQRRHEVRARVHGLRYETDAAARKARGQLQPDEGAGCADRDERRPALWSHGESLKTSPPPILWP